MPKVQYLSYRLGSCIPVYGKTRSRLRIIEKKSIKNNDSCNTFSFIMENHWGTHIDAPAHFFDNGKKISDYSARDLFFNNPCVVSLSLKKNSIIELKDIRSKISKNCDLVLIKTGFYKFRGLKVYSFDNPLISPRVAVWLRAKKPTIRAIGFDFISVGSCNNKELGRLAHRAFLDPLSNGEPILIIEDMDLSSNLAGLKKVWVAPLLVKQIDSAPCTVIGLFN